MKSVSVLLGLQYNPPFRFIFSLVERERQKVASGIEHAVLFHCTIYIYVFIK
jgi:hypothetical protein